MLRSLISNKIVKRFCHTHSKSNFCKFNDKIINIENHMKRLDILEKDILDIKKIIAFMTYKSK